MLYIHQKLIEKFKYKILYLHLVFFEDTKGVIKFRKSEKGKQHNGQKEKRKGQTMVYKTYT